MSNPQSEASDPTAAPEQDASVALEATQGRITGRRKRRQRRIEDSARRRAEREARANAPDTRSPAQKWDDFYKVKPTFFKDRHLLRSELPELMPPSVRSDPKAHIPKLRHPASSEDASTNDAGPEATIGNPEDDGDGAVVTDLSHPVVFLEAGCGVGNALFPVLRANPAAFAYAFDFSECAISVLKKSTEYHPSRVEVFVADLSVPETFVDRVAQPLDYAVLVWTLSALVPGVMMTTAIEAIVSLLKPSGMLLFRDYADGDMRMQAFEKRDVGKPREIERLYTRGDQTWAYFFKTDEVEKLMNDAGLETVECKVEDRVVSNRKNGTVMHRRWLIGRFRKPADT